jgi:hypothetical protein
MTRICGVAFLTIAKKRSIAFRSCRPITSSASFACSAVTLGLVMQAGGNRRLSPEHADKSLASGLKRFLERFVHSWAF